jgi:hypothetical protein
MNVLDDALAEIQTLWPGDKAVGNLCLDVWKIGLRKGEAVGLAHAADLRKSIRFYFDHKASLSKPLFTRIDE